MRGKENSEVSLGPLSRPYSPYCQVEKFSEVRIVTVQHQRASLAAIGCLEGYYQPPLADRTGENPVGGILAGGVGWGRAARGGGSGGAIPPFAEGREDARRARPGAQKQAERGSTPGVTILLVRGGDQPEGNYRWRSESTTAYPFYEPNQERVLICDKEKEAGRGGER